MNSIQSKVQSPADRKSALDAETTAELFYRYARSLFAYLRQHTASREDAEDLLHEVFAAALEWQSFGLLSDMEQEKWLWRVARNKVADTHRQKVRQPSLTLDFIVNELYAGEEQSPEYTLMRREEYARLREALERLPTTQQEALRLRFVQTRGSREKYALASGCSPAHHLHQQKGGLRHYGTRKILICSYNRRADRRACSGCTTAPADSPEPGKCP
jgi:RNA polymerase sigma factor (sigma-70 family)